MIMGMYDLAFAPQQCCNDDPPPLCMWQSPHSYTSHVGIVHIQPYVTKNDLALRLYHGTGGVGPIAHII